MSKYDSGRAYRMDGLNIMARHPDALNGIRFDSNRSALPTSASDFILFRSGDALKVWDGSAITTIVAGGALGGIPSFETIFQNDATFDTAGTTVTIDNSTGTNDVLTVTNTGGGSGDLIQITNAGTGNDIQGTSNTWKVTKAGVATFADVVISGTSAATTYTGAAVMTLLDNSATALQIGASGDTNIMVISTDNTTPEVIFNDNLRVQGGLATFISASNTVSNVLVTNNTITTFGVTQGASAGAVVIRSTSLTTGVLLRLQLAETALNGGFYLEALDSEGGGTSVFTIGEDGRVAIGGVEGSTMLAITLGDAVLSDGSLAITDDDNAASFSVTNNTATSAAVIALVSTTATFTGTTTGSYMHVSHSGLTTGTLLRLTAVAASTSVGVVDIAVDGLTSGSAFRITADTATFTTGGKLIELSSTAAVAGNLLTATTTGAYTGTGMILVTAGAATTGVLVSVVSTTGLTSGSLIRATSSTAGAIATNGAISFSATGAFTSTTRAGFLNIAANTTTSGVIAHISGTSVTDGHVLILEAVEATLTTGKYLACFDGAANDFSIGRYGATVIAGVAATNVLTITAGHAVITAGNLTLTAGNIVQTLGDNTLTAGNLTLTLGNLVMTAGNLTVGGGITTSSPTGNGLGYATGAGGTVTQATNRSTGVTLDKLCGKIQTDTTSLAAGASAEFTLTNSTIAIGDVVVVSQRSGSSSAAGVAGTLIVEVVGVAAGSCVISLNNNSSTTAETGAVVINFAVIKAVTA